MIEKVTIKQLNFIDIKEKESDVKYCSLKEVYNKIFPLFSEIFDLSKAYDSRAKFAEDENYINTRIEIGEILLNLRNSHKVNGLSDSDYEFLNELLDKWNKLTTEFPVFGGDVSRLYLFWFLSYIDILENIFYSEVKIISFVDLFFFEKILDYILSEKGEEQAKKEELFTVFERFKPPIDHYRALNLILSHLKINNKEVRDKLFEFYDNLIPKLKNKINYSDLLLTKANHLIKQKEYQNSLDLLEKHKNLLLKEKAREWLKIISKVVNEDYETGERIRNLFNRIEYLNKIIFLVSEESLFEFALILLYDFELKDDKVLKLLNKILDEKEHGIFTNDKYGLLLKRLWKYLNESDFKKVESFMKSYGENLEKYLPFEFLKFKISFYKVSGKTNELEKAFNNVEYLKKIVRKAKFKELREKISILILSEIELKAEAKNYLQSISSMDLTKIKKKELMKLYIKALIKQKEFKKINEEILFILNNYRLFSPEVFLEILFVIYWEEGIKNRLLEKRGRSVFHYLINGLESSSLKDINKLLFVWEVASRYYQNYGDYINILLELIWRNYFKEATIFKEDIDLLKNLTEKDKNSLVLEDELFEKGFLSAEKIFSSELLFDFFSKRQQKKIKQLNVLSLFDNLKLLFSEKFSKNFALKFISSTDLQFLENKVIDFSVGDQYLFFSDRKDLIEKRAILYMMHGEKREIAFLKNYPMEGGLGGVFFEVEKGDLFYYKKSKFITEIFKYDMKKKKEEKIFEFTGIIHAGNFLLGEDNIFIVDYSSSKLLIGNLQKKTVEVIDFDKENILFPEGLNLVGDNLLIGFRNCGGRGCYVKLDLNDKSFKKVKIPLNLLRVDTFYFLDEDLYFVSARKKLYLVKNNEIVFLLYGDEYFDSFFRIDMKNNRLYVIDSKNKKLYILFFEFIASL